MDALPTAHETDDVEFHASQQKRQLALQAAAAFVVVSLAWPYYAMRGEDLPWPHAAFAIAAVALLFACVTHQRWWWRLIHAAFAPLAWAVFRLSIDPIWFLLTFGMLLLFYRGAINGRIPLYLSNTATADVLATIAIQTPDLRFLDIGAGIASVLIPLAKARPDAHFTGIENAPATWLIGRLRTGGLSNCDWRWGDLWATDFRYYNVVYAFLSPAPMTALWEKIQREMPTGSVFISNSFAVPNIVPNQIIEVNDVRQTRLYCYQL